MRKKTKKPLICRVKIMPSMKFALADNCVLTAAQNIAKEAKEVHRLLRQAFTK